MSKFISTLILVIFTLVLNAQSNCICNNVQDGDGISGRFDNCPNTLPGISVDSHGCPLDTDGDGIPDYLDKQLITPTECQPVDSEGIGFCERHCPNEKSIVLDGHVLGPYSIYFAPNKSTLEPYIVKFLNQVAGSMRATPNFKVLVKANITNGSKKEYELAWHRLNVCREYLINKANIDKERLMFLIENFGRQNIIEIDSPPSYYESDCNLPNFKL
jgi:hypothetical protein